MSAILEGETAEGFQCSAIWFTPGLIHKSIAEDPGLKTSSENCCVSLESYALAAATWRDDLREDHNLTRARVRKHEAHFKVSPELFILANHCQWTTK